MKLCQSVFQTERFRRLAASLFCATMLLAQPFASGAGTVKIEKTTFEGWKNCYRMTNGEVELVAVADIGPRILHFSFVGGKNVLLVDEKTKGQTGGEEWNSYGGHRFWIAPEELETTYYPDNIPVRAETKGNTLVLTAIPEIVDENLRKEITSVDDAEKRMQDDSFREKLRLQKILRITMSEEGEVTVEHEAVSVGTKPMKIAPWALTVMTTGGVTVIPNVPFAPHGPGHFLPERIMALWSYTSLVDPRIKLMENFFTIKQDPNSQNPTKIGFSYTEGWVAYAVNGDLFLKALDYEPGANYPDNGCSVEIFTNPAIMEIESLGPLQDLQPGQILKHRERWFLQKVGEVQQTEESVAKMVKTLNLDKRL